MDQNEVSVAFEIVLEEIENTVAELNREGAQAFEAGKYDIARELGEKGEQMALIRGKVRDLQREWSAILGNTRVRPRKTTRQVAERLKRGCRTPEEVFRAPILQALVELGGSAPMNAVLERVEGKVKAQLTAYDYQPLPSDPNQIRWRNSVQWARLSLVRENLLANDSPRGIWEITSAGREWLAKANNIQAE